MAQNLAEPLSNVLWKVELESDVIGYRGEEIAKQLVERRVWFLLTAYMKGEMN